MSYSGIHKFKQQDTNHFFSKFQIKLIYIYIYKVQKKTNDTDNRNCINFHS